MQCRAHGREAAREIINMRPGISICVDNLFSSFLCIRDSVVIRAVTTKF